MKLIQLTRLLVPALILLALFSCKKDKLNVTDKPATPTEITTPDMSVLYSGSMVKTTLLGTIVDENNQPIIGAEVKVGLHNIQTDDNGIFTLFDIDVDAKRLYVTVEKDGYFKGSRALIPHKDNVSQVKIMLQSNTPQFVVNATSGGSVEIAQGVKITFPANAVVTTSGQSYSGNINIAAKYLSPENSNFGFLMPGDMQAVTTGDEEVTLMSYGMMNVELYGDAGEQLQVADGEKVKLEAQVPGSLAASAPSELPMWFFSDADGGWAEEGSSTLSNGVYTTEVSHFTWWNWDWKGPTATIEGYLLDCNGDPLSGVQISVGNNTGLYAYTDSLGYYTSWVPADPGISLEVTVNYLGVTGSSGVIGPFSVGQTFTVPGISSICPSKVAGKLVDCNNNPISGTVIFDNGGATFTVVADSAGNFELIVPQNVTGALTAFGSNYEYSTPQSVTTLAFNNVLNMGNIQVCGNAIPVVCSYYLTGGQYNNEFVEIRSLGTGQSEGAYIGGGGFLGSSMAATDAITFDDVNIFFSGNTVNTYTNFDVSFETTYDSMYLSTDSSQANFTIDVTQIGAVGGQVECTFFGDVKGWNSGVTYTISNGQCSIIRKQ